MSPFSNIAHVPVFNPIIVTGAFAPFMFCTGGIRAGWFRSD